MVTSQRWIQKTLRGGVLRAKAARAKAGVDKNGKVGRTQLTLYRVIYGISSCAKGI